MTAKTTLTYALATLAALFCLTAASARAQSGRIEREKENLILDVVNDFDAGRLSEARKKLHSILNADPDYDAAHYYLGLVSLAASDLDTAERELRAAVKLDTTNFWYRYRLATLYGMTDRQELTADIYNSLLRDYPKKSDLYYGLVDIYLSSGKLEDALGTIDQIDTVFGRSDMAVMTKFDILRRLDREEEGYALLEEYNREYSSPQVLTVLGDYNMSMYNDSTAIANYDEALDIMPGYAPALLGKAETFRITRRYPEYFDTLNRLVSDSGIPSDGKCEYLQALIQRADPNFLRNFRDEFDGVVERCLETHPGDTTATALAGVYYYATGRYDQSKAYFKQNVDAWPDAVGAAYNYAEAIMYMNEWRELSDFSKASFERFPDEYNFLEMATLADYNLGEVDSVILTCERIIDLSPDSTAVLNAYSTLGDMYCRKGENARAYKAYEKALKINPSYNPVLNNYAYYLSLEGKSLKKAAAMSKTTVDTEPDNPTYLDTYGWILHLQGRSAEAKPVFKHAMLYGGKDNAVILDHYAEVLYALGEYDLAFVYWNQALSKDTDGEIEGLKDKIRQRRSAANETKRK